MSDPFGAATERVRREMLDRQDEWIEQQAAARGVTVEQLAEVYTLEWGPIEFHRDGNEDFIFRASQEIRLKRRDEPVYRLVT